MNWRNLARLAVFLLTLTTAGCNESKPNFQAEAPPPLKLQKVEDRNLFKVDHPEQFTPMRGSGPCRAPSQLKGNRNRKSGYFPHRSGDFDCHRAHRGNWSSIG